MSIKKLDTRDLLADALLELLKEKSFESVTVEDIINKCGASRPTFYRHFKDKYDLMDWIYLRHANKFNEYRDTAGYKFLLFQSASYLKELQDYFTSIIKFHGQNSFEEFLFSYIFNYYKEHIIEKAGADQLTDDVLFSLKMYTAGLVYLTSEWLNSGLKESPEKISQIEYDNMPKALKELLE
ncbi:TetR/AcrR family transcriptional regulator C-terminal domain-containing protein [Caproiciproducens sp.]